MLKANKHMNKRNTPNRDENMYLCERDESAKNNVFIYLRLVWFVSVCHPHTSYCHTTSQHIYMYILKTAKPKTSPSLLLLILPEPEFLFLNDTAMRMCCVFLSVCFIGKKEDSLLSPSIFICFFF